MAFANNLSTDVVYHIFRHITAPPRSQTSYLLHNWKQQLVFLSVCKSWRTTTQRLVYSLAIIEPRDPNSNIPAAHRANPAAFLDNQCMATNIPLIMINWDLQAVRRLYAAIQLSVKSHLFLRCLDQIFVVRYKTYFAQPAPEIPVRDDIDELMLSNNIDMCFIGSAKLIALALGEILPNVCQLEFNLNPDEVQVAFVDELVDCFKPNITYFRCVTENYLPDILKARNLQTIDFTTKQQGNIIDPLVYPQMLKNMRMRFRTTGINWNMFCKDEAFGLICFNNLKTLTIEGGIEAISGIKYNDSIVLNFSQLTDLTIYHISISPKVAKYLMHAPLVRLNIGGYADDALALLNFSTNTLKHLSIKLFDKPGEQFEYDSFIRKTNSMFLKTQGIEHVYCEINIATDGHFIISSIHWPHLTYLNVQTGVDFSALITILPCLTNLVVLNVELYMFEMVEMNSAISKLESMQSALSRPLLSIIEKLIVRSKYFNVAQYPQFITALDKMCFYFPRLNSKYI